MTSREARLHGTGTRVGACVSHCAGLGGSKLIALSASYCVVQKQRGRRPLQGVHVKTNGIHLMDARGEDAMTRSSWQLSGSASLSGIQHSRVQALLGMSGAHDARKDQQWRIIECSNIGI